MAKGAWSMPMQHGRICWREKMSIKCRLSWKGRGNCVREGPQKIEAFSIKRGGGLACRWAFFHQKQVFFAPLYALFSVSLKWKIEKMSIRGDGLSDTWCKMPYIFAFFGLLPKLFLIYILVKRAGSGICLCEMLGLKIEVSDTLGFRIRMGRKKGGLLVEMIKHQGNMDVFAEGENVDKMSS